MTQLNLLVSQIKDSMLVFQLSRFSKFNQKLLELLHLIVKMKNQNQAKTILQFNTIVLFLCL